MTIRSEDDELWIRRFRPSPDSAVSLLCFPHAGGSASAYFAFSEALSPSVEVLAVQYPGRQDRRWEAPGRTVAELADGVTDALADRPGRPLALFGHSMGGAIAFEVARRLEARGRAPVALFVSGRRAPSRHREALGAQPTGEEAGPPTDEEIAAELRRLGGTDAAVLADAALMQMLLPVVRADYRVAGSYRGEPGAAVGCPLTVLVGDRDPETTIEEAGAWRAHTTGGFGMRVCPGGHFFIESNRSEVFGVITEALLPVGGV
ncbi:thioesterase II family protein [Streptomyces syringium]|uniref:thioesterase II family protein n=1 Tax=Streptomyces syringium TaxID=76729 RepID=UPI003D8ED85D